MGRKGYLSIYADDKTQEVFDEFCRIKGIKKTEALTGMLDLYMLSQDEALYLELKKKVLNVSAVRDAIASTLDRQSVNDYIFIKLSMSEDGQGNAISGDDTVKAYIRNMESNGLGYTWFSTNSLHSGMAREKVNFYNNAIAAGEEVYLLLAIADEDNDIKYRARVLEVVSSRDQSKCPGDVSAIPEEYGPEEKAKIWLRLTDIEPETDIKAEMLTITATGANLKQTISGSQYHFGYVAIEEE